MDDLIERVARAICLNHDIDPDMMVGVNGKIAEWVYSDARAALAIAFEEAARMADGQAEHFSCEPGAMSRGVIAAALRARAKEFEVKP